MYWRGGPNPTADMNVTLYAGAGARRRHDDQLDQLPAHQALGARAVGARARARGRSTAPSSTATSTRSGSASSVNDRCSDLNGPQQRMKEGAERLGWSFKTITRNTDASRYTPETRRLHRLRRPVRRQAVDGADLPRRRARARRRARSCAASPSACWSRAAARPASRRSTPTPRPAAAPRVTVRAPRVVVACGRARVAGAAAALAASAARRSASNLRLHPCTARRRRLRSEDQQAWWGAPQAGLVRRVRRRRGRLRLPDRGDAVRARHWSGSATAVHLGRRPQADDGASCRFGAHLHRPDARPRRRPGDDRRERPGGAVVLARRRARRRNHAPRDRGPGAPARGGRRARDRAARRRHARRWRGATTSTRYIARLKRVPLRAGGFRLFAAHQMGTCRMGADPQTSVADPLGRAARHHGRVDRRRQRVPDLLGTNPMITIMALAHRTARGDRWRRSGRHGRAATA